jgi:homoserine dehydrogenase
VHPTLISRQHLIANVNGVMNAVVVKGDSAGSTLYYGAGAGARATASSVVADIIDIARGTRDHRSGSVIPPLAFDNLRHDLRILDISEIETEYYLRIPARDKVGVMAKISQVLTNYGINIEAVIQKEPHGEHAVKGVVPVVILTSRIKEATMDIAINVIEALDEVDGKVMRVRVEQFDGEND